MQKTYTTSYLTKRHVVNTGQLARYFIDDNHEAIIQRETWEAVQQELARLRAFRKKHGLRGLNGGRSSAFLSRFFCETCTHPMQRIYRVGVRKPYWICDNCGKRITDESLREQFCEEFNQIIKDRERHLLFWKKMQESGTALERFRASRWNRSRKENRSHTK